jgi:hypothetical protein
MKTDLNQLTDTGLSAAFAVEVAGYLQGTQSGPNGRWVHNGVVWMCPSVLTFSTSMDDVLPWLSEATAVSIHRIYALNAEGYVDKSLPLKWRVTVYQDDDFKGFRNDADTLPRAACIALILAARAEKEAAK